MDVLYAALRAVDPYRAVSDALRQADIAPDERIYVLGAGKAGAAMARAAEDVLGERIAGGLVIVKEAHADTGGDPLKWIELVEAAHPVPDRRGAEATSRLLEMAESAGERSLVLCLISGGGSALLASPAEGVSLEDLQATTGLLLRAGTTINDLNAVRKHISTASGGQLARMAAPARVLSLILSDVVGSPLDVIASGPTAPDPTTFADALGIIERYGLSGVVAPSVVARLKRGAAGQVRETPKPGDPLFGHVENRVIASNVLAVEAAAHRASELGLNALVASTFVEGEAREVGTVLAGIAKEEMLFGRPSPRPACILFGGETTVTVRGIGVGGRNTELALSAALALDGFGPDVVVSSFATDGGDGNCEGAGAIADGTTIERARSLDLDARAALDNNDSYTFWSALGDAIVTGPTGTNVNDVMALFAF
jgi:hydroxypyruvate reductase